MIVGSIQTLTLQFRGSLHVIYRSVSHSSGFIFSSSRAIYFAKYIQDQIQIQIQNALRARYRFRQLARFPIWTWTTLRYRHVKVKVVPETLKLKLIVATLSTLQLNIANCYVVDCSLPRQCSKSSATAMKCAVWIFLTLFTRKKRNLHSVITSTNSSIEEFDPI